MIVATPCNSLSIQLPDSASEFHVLDGFKKDPTRFEFTDEELIYWNELRKAQGSAQLDASVFRGLEKVTFYYFNSVYGFFKRKIWYLKSFVAIYTPFTKFEIYFFNSLFLRWLSLVAG